MRAFLICLLAVAAIATEVKEETKNHNRRGIVADPPVQSVEILRASSIAASPNGYSDSGFAGGYGAGLSSPVASAYSTLNGAVPAGVAGEYSPVSNSGLASGYASGLNSGLNLVGLASSYGNGLDNGVIGGRQIIDTNGPVARTVVNRVVQVAVPVPQPVEVARNVPVRVPVPVAVEHNRPVIVRVLQPYPIHVDRPYAVNVDRPVPVPVLQAVRVTYPRVAVPVPVPQAYIVPLQPASGIPLGSSLPLSSSSSLNYANQGAGLGAYASSSGYAGVQSYAGINSDNIARYADSGVAKKW